MTKSLLKKECEKAARFIGKEKIACLQNLFESLQGQPPHIDKKRYRADHPSDIGVLDSLEQRERLIQLDRDMHAYVLSPYALSLIKNERAMLVVEIMSDIYGLFKSLYAERLDKPVSVAEITNKIENPEQDVLDALYYLSETNGVWVGLSIGFPYADNAAITINEEVIKNDTFLDVLIKHYQYYYRKRKKRFTSEDYFNPITLEAKASWFQGAKNKIQNHPLYLLGALMFTMVVAIGAFTDAIEHILAFIEKYFHKS